MRDKVTRDALAIGIAVGIFAIPFGVLAVATGATVPMASAMSALVFAGGSQFAAIGVIAAGGSPIAAVASGLMLNGRYTAFGMALAPLLPGSLGYRAAASQFIIDESSAFALARRDRPEEAPRAFWWTGVSVFVLWNLGTIIGAVAGETIGDPKTFGLDAAFPAGFLALLMPTLKTRNERAAAVLGAVLALIAIPLLPAGAPVLVSALGAVIVWCFPLSGETEDPVEELL